LAFGIGLPILVARWWAASKSHSKNNILQSTMTNFYREFKEDFSFRQTIELLASADEFEFLELYPLGWDDLSVSIKRKMDDEKFTEKVSLFDPKRKVCF
jgi:preprotein translocase subunit Sec63